MGNAKQFSLNAEVFTAGQVAKICSCSSHTVAKWIDTGMLSGYRLPASQDRRVTRQAFLDFLRKQGMRDILARLEPAEFCLLAGLSTHLEQRLHELLLPATTLRVARCLFDVGFAMHQPPSRVVLDTAIGQTGEVRRVVERLVEECRRVVVLIPEDAPSTWMLAFPGTKLAQHPVSAEMVKTLLEEDS